MYQENNEDKKKGAKSIIIIIHTHTCMHTKQGIQGTVTIESPNKCNICKMLTSKKCSSTHFNTQRSCHDYLLSARFIP